MTNSINSCGGQPGKENMLGMVLGKAVIIKNLGLKKVGEINRTAVECRCECGTIFQTFYNYLKTGRKRSCGCLQKEVAKSKCTHGLTNHKLYNVWATMKTRCYNSKHPNYIHWGARGIRVCDEWGESFAVFFAWAINSGYRAGLQLDRIDNNGNYEPGNCRWVTGKINSNNRRSSRRIQLDGVVKTVAEWARYTGIGEPCLRARIRKGWDIRKALNINQ